MANARQRTSSELDQRLNFCYTCTFILENSASDLDCMFYCLTKGHFYNVYTCLPLLVCQYDLSYSMFNSISFIKDLIQALMSQLQLELALF